MPSARLRRKNPGRLVDYFQIELGQPVQIRGFGGPPIVDADGHLVGVMTVRFTPFTTDEDYQEAGGQDGSLGIQLLDTQRTR